MQKEKDECEGEKEVFDRESERDRERGRVLARARKSAGGDAVFVCARPGAVTFMR